MNKNIKYLLFSLLFCLTFIVLFSIEVFAVEGTVSFDGKALGKVSNYSVDDTVAKSSALQTSLKNDMAKAFEKMADEKYANTNIIPSYTISGGAADGNTSLPITAKKEEIENIINNCVVQSGNAHPMGWVNFDIEIGGTKYTIHTFTSQIQVNVPDGNGGTVSKVVNKNSDEAKTYGLKAAADTPDKKEITAERLEYQYKVSQGAITFLTDLSNAARLGIIGGSVGFGYNVGTFYSDTQRPLSDLMEKRGNEYDFKANSGVKTAFDYYMSPIMGKLSLNVSPKLPSKDEEWIELMKSVDFIDGTSIKLSSEFQSFVADLDTQGSEVNGKKVYQINEKGLKVSDSVSFTNGAKKFSSITASKKPKSVLSYTLKLAYPYVFKKSGSYYKLVVDNLRIDNEYSLCLVNGWIYDNEFKQVTSIGHMGLNRNYVYLYHQKVRPTGEEQTDTQQNNQDDDITVITNQKVGIVLVGQFEEAVIDTLETDVVKYYGTGRKITFTNAYSDLLPFEKANDNLMFASGGNDRGKEGFIPKYTSFLCDEKESAILDSNSLIHINALVEGDKDENGNLIQVESLPELSNEDIDSILLDRTNHIDFSVQPQYFKMYVKFHKLVSYEKMDELNKAGGNTNNLQSLEEQEKAGIHHSFIIVRNNKFVNDPSLISWLKTDSARATTFVDAEKLLQKITGDFTGDIVPLTYDDWKRMQEIKNEISTNKDMWIVRVLNVMSILMGVFLIIFAILICLAYWIDVLNTLTDFSILQFISMGKLYPVSHEDTIVYLRESKGKTKYVQFKDVLIIAFVCCAIGILFMEVHNVVSFIVYLYNYILSTLGGN